MKAGWEREGGVQMELEDCKRRRSYELRGKRGGGGKCKSVKKGKYIHDAKPLLQNTR